MKYDKDDILRTKKHFNIKTNKEAISFLNEMEKERKSINITETVNRYNYCKDEIENVHQRYAKYEIDEMYYVCKRFVHHAVNSKEFDSLDNFIEPLWQEAEKPWKIRRDVKEFYGFKYLLFIKLRYLLDNNLFTFALSRYVDILKFFFLHMFFMEMKKGKILSNFRDSADIEDLIKECLDEVYSHTPFTRKQSKYLYEGTKDEI